MLSGCSSTPPIARTVVTKQTQYVLPPQSLMGQCLPAECSSDANADLPDCIIQLLAVITKCDTDLHNIETWRMEKQHEQSIH
ncbi:Rz1-like lysis system protein LysC [Shewanella baltica]|uniref:Rz1-like lysis system protein LysC n=1 Tax=Shewanella baltica TaxID=62322 RepID=UPI003D03F595